MTSFDRRFASHTLFMYPLQQKPPTTFYPEHRNMCNGVETVVILMLANMATVVRLDRSSSEIPTPSSTGKSAFLVWNMTKNSLGTPA